MKLLVCNILQLSNIHSSIFGCLPQNINEILCRDKYIHTTGSSGLLLFGSGGGGIPYFSLLSLALSRY
jgi:hypothetical protein